MILSNALAKARWQNANMHMKQELWLMNYDIRLHHITGHLWLFDILQYKEKQIDNKILRKREFIGQAMNNILL